MSISDGCTRWMDEARRWMSIDGSFTVKFSIAGGDGVAAALNAAAGMLVLGTVKDSISSDRAIWG